MSAIHCPQRPAVHAVDNDVHSRLNPTVHARLLRPTETGALVRAFDAARAQGARCAIAGARHAMGGQQFAGGGWLLDMSAMRAVLDFDADAGLVRAQGGLCWPELQAFLAARRDRDGSGWAIRQKQTGADVFSLGGAVAANVHGRCLDRPPLVADIESLCLVTPDGGVHEVSRDAGRELFSLAVGGYGLFGAVAEVTLRLVRRQKLERTVALCTREELMDAFDARRREGCLYGDFQFAIDPASADFLRLGVLSCYRPLPRDASMPPPAHGLDAAQWRELLWLAHVDKSEAFRRYAAFYGATDGQRYWSDDHQFGVYLDGYHDAIDQRLCHRGSELISELYVPPERLDAFLATVAEDLRHSGADPIYGTVRLIERDDETVLAWARQRWACTVLNLHVRHDPDGIARARADCRRLAARALEHGGSFYLTYHRHATATQLRAAYPRIDAFLAAKRRHDPQGVLASDWYRALCTTLSA